MKVKALLKALGKVIWPRGYTGKIISVLVMAVLFGLLFMQFIYNPFFELYTGVENAKLHYEDSDKQYTDAEFEALAAELTRELRFNNAGSIVKDTGEFSRNVKIGMLMSLRSASRSTNYSHIAYFRQAGIRRYEGPKTCLGCHKTIAVHDQDGKYHEVNTLDDVLNSVHFKFQSTASGFTTYGYDGRKVNEGAHKIPVGKIDRACGIPGSFSWTGWATLVKSYPGNKDIVKMRSEGCGQCHIGGNYHPATEKMMPIGDVPGEAKQGVDCLICHADAYDMNKRYVIQDANGMRWNQDRSLRSALTVGLPKNNNCLNCHQHNMGGDLYHGNLAAQKPGYTNQRLMHPGAKRGNPFSAETDVHYRAGLICTDCHVPQGHKIPRGVKGTDLVANDLPGVKVECENCHTTAPHTSNPLTRVILNGHVNRLACETCHITGLEDLNVVLRDWVSPTWNNEEGIWTPTDIYRSGKAGKGFTYLWFNGNGTFLANALGNNPNKSATYNPLMNQLTRITDPEIIAEVRKQATELKKRYKDIDVDKYVESVTNTLSQLPKSYVDKRRDMIEKYIRPLMNMGQSRIYPFKLFNARMYEDMNNYGPFGAMILPFDYNTYYETGRPLDAVVRAVLNPIVKRMYEAPFKVYMMDEFMKYFGVGSWTTEYPIDANGRPKNVQPNWMRQMGTLMVNHSITRDARQCSDCHSENGIMDFNALGYTPDRVRDLRNLPEMKYFNSIAKPSQAQPGMKEAKGPKPAGRDKKASAGR